MTEIAVALYEGVTALDAVGPYEVLSRVPGAKVRFVAPRPGAVTADTGMLSLVAEASLAEVPAPDVVLVPGGIASSAVARDEAFVGWVRAAHETSTWTTSVCAGALILGAAGILDGLRATTHWLDYEELAAFGAQVTPRRVVEQGKVITSAGVSSGIDMALTLAARMAGDEVARAIQLAIEYDPQPPFDAGSLEKAGPEVEARVRSAVAARTPSQPARMV